MRLDQTLEMPNATRQARGPAATAGGIGVCAFKKSFTTRCFTAELAVRRVLHCSALANNTKCRRLMKIAPVLLVASLVGNLALGFVLTRHLTSGSAPSTTDASANAPAIAGSSQPQRPTAAEAAATIGTNEKTWEKLASAGALPDLIARLRAAGFPPSVIRAIVATQIREQYAAKRKELFANVEDVPFWQNRRMMLDPKILAAHRELQLEQTQKLKDLLGSNPADEDELMQHYRKRQYGDLPPDKADQLRRVAADYNDLRSEIYANANGMLMPEDREQVAYLEKEMRSDLAKVLTPDELMNYELRSSSTANMLRSQLTTFQPSEAEFRALFGAARSIEEKFGSVTGGLTSPDQYRQRQAAINEQAKLALTPDRYAAFEQAVDPRNAMLNRIVARYDLPTTVVPQVNAVQQDVRSRSEVLRSNRDLTPDQRSAQLAALAQEANAKLAPLLGAKGFAAYKQSGGQWIQSLTQTRPATVTAPGSR